MAHRHARALVVALLLTISASPALAGPPLVCHPFDTAGFASLPWGTGPGWNQPRADYDRSRLVADTLGVLTPDVPVFPRVETLRRAVLYSGDNRTLRQALFAALDKRAEALAAKGGRQAALARFDAGTAAVIADETRHILAVWDDTRPRGYKQILQALDASGDVDMEVIAALAAITLDKSAVKAHVTRVMDTAPAGSAARSVVLGHFALAQYAPVSSQARR